MNFFSRYKKLFFILFFLVLIFLLGWLLWQFFFKVKTQTPTATIVPTSSITGLPLVGTGGTINNSLNGSGNLPSDTEAPSSSNQPNINPNNPSNLAVGGRTKVERINNANTLDPVINSSGQVQYYNQDDNKFYQVDKNGKVTPLSDREFYQVQKVVWAPDRKQAILEYPDHSKILYNFATKKQVTLPAYWKDFSFSPSSNKIISKSIGLDPENRWLMISQSDGSQATALEPIGTKDASVYPSWSPNKQIVAMYTQGIDFNRQEVYFVGLHHENFKSTIIEGRGFESQWSTKGDRLLYSVYNSRDNFKPRLWIVNANVNSIGQNRHSLNLETWSNKCTFATDSEIYCAVPEKLETGAGLYPELADQTKDNLYKINLNTGTKKLIAIPQNAYNISQIIVPGDQNYLYFTDKQTGSIYKVRLK